MKGPINAAALVGMTRNAPWQTGGEVLTSFPLLEINSAGRLEVSGRCSNLLMLLV